MIDQFIGALTAAVSRQIDRVIILALHGITQEVMTITDAIKFIESYDDDGKPGPFERFEIQVRYNNGDIVEGRFKEKDTAIEFLRTYQPVDMPIA